MVLFEFLHPNTLPLGLTEGRLQHVVVPVNLDKLLPVVTFFSYFFVLQVDQQPDGSAECGIYVYKVSVVTSY